MNGKILILAIAIVAFVALSGCAEQVCGDGTCGTGEDSNSCPADCSTYHFCGNSVCETDESNFNSQYYCPADCGLPTGGNIEVKVIDSATNEPIQGAIVTLSLSYRGIIVDVETTDSYGKVLFEDINSERYSVEATEAGYNPSEKVGVIPLPGRTKYVTIELTAQPSTTGNLQVKVIDSATAEPIQGATVDLNGGPGGLVLKTALLVKSITINPDTHIGQVEIADVNMLYNEGDFIEGLEGTGAYEGQEMSVKVAAIIQTGPAASYQARFELYDSSGNKVDQRTVGEGTYLNNVFASGQSGTVYYQGDIVTGLIGTGAYAGQEMTVKIDAIVQSSHQPAPYQAKFNLYDQNGLQVNSLIAGAGIYLNQNFVDRAGNLVLQTEIYVKNVFMEPTKDKGGVELVVSLEKSTNSDGIALFEGLVPGTYTVVLTKAGYNTRALTVRVDAGITTEKEIELTATCRIVCTSDAACNDNNAMTVDTCLNRGTCSARCSHTTIIPRCGNGVCDANENITNCPVDCNTSSEVVCTSSDPSRINVTDANITNTPANGQKDFGIIFLTNLTGGSLATVGLSSATGAFAGNTSITLGLSTSYISSAGITLTPDEMITGGTGETTYSESAIKIEYHDYAGFTRNATITCTGPITVNNT